MKYFSPSLFAAFFLRPKPSNDWMQHSQSPLLDNTYQKHHQDRTVAKKSIICSMTSSDSQSKEPVQELNLMEFDKETFQDSSLQMAVEIFNEAKDIAQDGDYQKACDEFQSGLFIGRKAVQQLQESENDSSAVDDDPRLALEWLITTYLSMFQCRVALGDWNKARADAWAACNYAQYGPNGSLGGDGMDAKSFQLEISALSAMWIVCQNTDDKINEWQTLQSLQKLLKLPFPEKVSSNITRQQVDKRIKVLGEELETQQ